MKSKWDGFRAIPYVKDNLFTVKSRKGKEFKNNFPELEEITHLAKNVVVDSEIVIMKQCKVDFCSLQESVSKGKEKGFLNGAIQD